MKSYEGFKAVKHDLLELTDAATVFVAGDPASTNVVILSAGFPCDHASFIPLGAYLANTCGCFVGVTCFPEFDREGPPLRPEGYDMWQTGDCFGKAVAALKAQSTAKKPVFTIVVHDFGIVPGFMHANSAGCDKLVVFDVLPSDTEKDKPDSITHVLIQLNYNAMFATSFWLSRIWQPLGRAWFFVGSTLIFNFFARWLAPTGLYTDLRFGMFSKFGGQCHHSKEMAGSVCPGPWHCNPYFHAMKNLGNKPEMGRFTEAISFDRSLEKQPICYIYGAEKNTQFQLKSQLRKLEAKEGCEVHKIERAGHWCYKHKPEECFQIVRKFIGV